MRHSKPSRASLAQDRTTEDRKERNKVLPCGKEQLNAVNHSKGDEMTTMSLKDQIAAVNAKIAEATAALATAQQANALLAAARLEATKKGIETLQTGFAATIAKADLPDDTIYPIVITIQQDKSFAVKLSQVGVEKTGGSRAVTYGGKEYPSAQAVVDHCLATGIIAAFQVPKSKYSAHRLLQSLGIVIG